MAEMVVDDQERVRRTENKNSLQASLASGNNNPVEHERDDEPTGEGTLPLLREGGSKRAPFEFK